jgi:hypothetical protein
MKTLSLRVTEPVRVRTMDARHGDDAAAVDRILNGIRNSLGTLSDDDVERIEAILQKYTGASSTTTQMGVSRAGDAADVGARGAATVRANIEHNQSVATGYRDFWDAKNAELARSIRR